MLGTMRATPRRSWPWLGFALLLAGSAPLGCTTGDGTEGTTSPTGPMPSEETAEPTTTGDGTMSDPSTAAEPSTGPDPGTTTSVDDTSTADTMASTTAAGLPRVVMETTLGTMVIELDDVAAPVTVANFLAYVDAGFYDGSDGLGATIFHRVITGFVAQGGGLTENLAMKATMPPIVNESGNGLTNVRGTIAMARTNEPDSATSQFYLNLIDNPFLDDPPGYAVFGTVVEGIEVMDAIAAVAVDPEDVPIEPVIIVSVTLQ
jgi:peptidyl-prolyl cis-trans isomerase A (cyclophilin A)